MSIQTRTTALQNEIVRLYCTFEQDGLLADPETQPIVTILDTDGVTVLDTVTAVKETIGIWFADYFIPATLPLGQYYDEWAFQWSSGSSVTEKTLLFLIIYKWAGTRWESCMYVLSNLLQAVAVILDIVLTIYMWVIIIRALLSWVNPDPYNPIVQFLHSITEPVLYRVRKALPMPGMGLDLSPIIVLLAIIFLQSFLVQTLKMAALNLR